MIMWYLCFFFKLRRMYVSMNKRRILCTGKNTIFTENNLCLILNFEKSLRSENNIYQKTSLDRKGQSKIEFGTL